MEIYRDSQLGVITIADQIGEEVDYYLEPPHTSRASAFASINRGSNMLGGLTEDLYVCSDCAWSPKHYVLWAGDDGTQMEDPTPRIRPVAWCEIPNDAGQQRDRDDVSPRLIYAYVATLTRLYGHFDQDCRISLCDADYITESDLREVFDRALAEGIGRAGGA